MSNIFDLAQTSIKLGGFKLEDKLRELTSIMLVGQINPFEYDELAGIAQQYADQESNPTDTNILGVLRTINAELADIKKRIKLLEDINTLPSISDEYPEWKRWNGLPESGYKFGDKVSHLGIKYVSNYPGLNVWEPGVQGTEALWSVVS